jgi:hypothetical protein
MNVWEKLSQILQDPAVKYEVAQTARYRMGKDKLDIPAHQKYFACLTIEGDVYKSPRAYGETQDAATVAVIKLYEARQR